MEAEAFWNWFAGFIDGEGCFYISKSRNYFTPGLIIVLRVDDIGTLQYIQHTLGYGVIRNRKNTNNGLKYASNPQAEFVLSDKKGCQFLATNLSGRLHSKKARDFELWASAVKAMEDVSQQNRMSDIIFEYMLDRKEELSEIKRFAA